MHRSGNRSLSVLAFITSAALLAACGGGSGGSSSPAAPTGLPTSAPQGIQRANLTITFPVGHHTSSNRKSPQYISPSTTEMVVVVNTVNGGTPPGGAAISTTYALTVGTNCTLSSGTETCTLSVLAPPGSVNYTFNATDGTNTLSTLTTTIVNTVGTNNLPSITLLGVVSTVTISGATLSASDTSHATTGETLTVTAFDADGNQIVSGSTPATYNNPITLTDNDATGQTQLSVNGHMGATSVVTNSPSEVVTLIYTGQAVNTFTITASGAGISGSGTISASVFDIAFSGTTNDDAAHGGLTTDPNYGQQTLFFTTTSGSQVIDPAELGYSTSPFDEQFAIAVSAGCAGIATASAGPAISFTITAAGSTGICSAQVKERGAGYPLTNHTANTSGSPTHDGTFWISVTSSDVTVNAKRRQ
jgi:hypothetical protein